MVIDSDLDRFTWSTAAAPPSAANRCSRQTIPKMIVPSAVHVPPRKDAAGRHHRGGSGVEPDGLQLVVGHEADRLPIREKNAPDPLRSGSAVIVS
jgi:hypothetical protein